MSEKEIFWLSDIPSHCQVTRMEITDEFVDGRIPDNSWALMHPQAHIFYGKGIGAGKGQRYKKREDGKWVKIDG